MTMHWIESEAARARWGHVLRGETAPCRCVIQAEAGVIAAV